MNLAGTVVEGKKQGREMGFPTANILNAAKIPAGIFAALAFVDDKTYQAAIYVGAHAPDVLEAHLLDFSGDLYGKELSIEIKEKIRDDMKFMGTEEMKKQIAEDIQKVRSFLKQSKD